MSKSFLQKQKQIEEEFSFLDSFKPENYGNNKKEKLLSKDIIKIIRMYNNYLSYIIDKNIKFNDDNIDIKRFKKEFDLIRYNFDVDNAV